MQLQQFLLVRLQAEGSGWPQQIGEATDRILLNFIILIIMEVRGHILVWFICSLIMISSLMSWTLRQFMTEQQYGFTELQGSWIILITGTNVWYLGLTQTVRVHI